MLGGPLTIYVPARPASDLTEAMTTWRVAGEDLVPEPPLQVQAAAAGQEPGAERHARQTGGCSRPRQGRPPLPGPGRAPFPLLLRPLQRQPLLRLHLHSGLQRDGGRGGVAPPHGPSQSAATEQLPGSVAWPARRSEHQSLVMTAARQGLGDAATPPRGWSLCCYCCRGKLVQVRREVASR